jgi:hypothetical protein
MKSFNQFLQESYLSEEPAGRPAGRRTGGPTPEEVKAQIDAKEAEKAKRAAARQPSGAAARPDLQFKKSTVTSPAKPKPAGAAKDPWNQFPKKPQPQMGLPKEGPSSTLPGRTLAPAGGTSAKPALPAAGQTARGGSLAKVPSATPAKTPEIKSVSVSDVTPKPKALPASGQTSAPKPQASTPKVQAAKPSVGKPPMVKGLKAPGVRGGGVLAGAIDTAVEKSSGSGWARSLAKGATTALGTVAGGALGSAAGPVGTFAGGTAGGMAASKAFDTAAGANAVQRKAIATANRQGQAGGAIKGIGGKTTFDTKKNTITTGTGSQRKTAQLGKTSVVTGPGGKQDIGYLAYKGGKAVYKRADTKSLAQTSSNPLERIGRSLFAGAYKKSDAANAAKKLATARQSDTARNKALGVKFGPGK